MSEKKTHSIAVAGNPNCGKTTLFNGLTGANQRVGNWPGVTVEKKEGAMKVGDEVYNIVDLPGIYSLSVVTDDEKVTRDYVLGGEVELVVNIVDATNLERNLYLTTQLLEMKVPLLIVLNMMDIAGKKGLYIDVDLLSKQLGSPVIAVSAVDPNDVQRVKEAIRDAEKEKHISESVVAYPNEVEDVIRSFSPRLSCVAREIGADSRWIALKLLERDEWVTEKVCSAGLLNKDAVEAQILSIERLLKEPLDVVIADYKYGFINGITRKAVIRRMSRESATDKIDKVVMNRYLGIPVFFIAMFLVFWLTITVGGALIGLFELVFGAVFVDGLGKLLSLLGSPAWLITILADGVGAGIKTVATFIPVISMMFLTLSLLEDSGYMARAAFVMDRFMGWIGLPGKSFVPMLVGFGCTVPAVLATRTLDTKRDKILTVFMTPFMSCGARFSVYTLFATAFFPNSVGIIVFSIYVIGIGFAVLTGFLLKKTVFQGEPSALIMELPPYHAPRIKHILLHTWNSLKVFVMKAGKMIVLAVLLLSILNSLGTDGTFGNENTGKSILARAGKIITPIFEPMGVDKKNWPAAVAILTGMFAKEAVIGTLNSLYSQIHASDSVSSASDKQDGVRGAEETGKDADFMSQALRRNFSGGPLSVFAYLLFILLYFPCIATLGAAMKEIGKRYGMLMAAYNTVLAWIVATLFFQIACGHSPVWIATAVAGIGVVVVLFRIAGMRRRKAAV